MVLGTNSPSEETKKISLDPALPLDRTVFLHIDLKGIQKNFTFMATQSPSAIPSVVLKSNAYGIGIQPVGKALWDAGARHFFVSTLQEGIQLRNLLPEALVYILNGLQEGTSNVFLTHNLTPVLLDLNQIQKAQEVAKGLSRKWTVLIQVDVGMGRFGLSLAEAQSLSQCPSLFSHLEIQYLLGHLSCGSLSSHPANQEELQAFRVFRSLFPGVKGTLANSAGILLGPEFHHDMTRMGIALYGGNPLEDRANPLTQVLEIQARILQVRTLPKGTPIGYDRTHTLHRDSRIATVNLGFGTGFFRNLSNCGIGYVNNISLPILGRISMDWLSVDITDAPEILTRPGSLITFVDTHHTIDELAALAKTTSYDFISQLGDRYHPLYSS